jgi:hypothetical protein
MPPLVTVKQPDGSYAKITLEEFLQRQKNAAQSAVALSTAAATDSVVQSVVPPPLPTPPEVPPLIGQNTEPLTSHSVNAADNLEQEKNDRRTVVSETGSVVKAGLHSPVISAASEKAVLPEPHTPTAPSTEMLVPTDQEVAVSTPFNMFKHETTPPPVTMVSKPVIPLEPLPVQRISVPDQITPQIRDTKRPSVTDVVYRPVAIGPIEEIQGMSLTDRRSRYGRRTLPRT